MYAGSSCRLVHMPDGSYAMVNERSLLKFVENLSARFTYLEMARACRVSRQTLYRFRQGRFVAGETLLHLGYGLSKMVPEYYVADHQDKYGVLIRVQNVFPGF